MDSNEGMDRKTLVDLQCRIHGRRLYFESTGSEDRDRRVVQYYQKWVKQSKAPKSTDYYEEEARRTLAKMGAVDPRERLERGIGRLNAFMMFVWIAIVTVVAVILCG